MRNLTRLIFSILLIFVFVGAQSQVRFGLKGGLNMNTMEMKSMGISFDPKALIGFHVGAVAELGLPGNLKIQPGIFYTVKGNKIAINTEELTMNPTYIEVPVNVVYLVGISALKLGIQAGPYLAYGIGGKFKSGSESQDISWGTDVEMDDFKPLDFGVNLGASLYVGKLFVSGQYGLGLANISPYTADDTAIKTRVFSLSLGYFFGGN